MIQLTGEDTRRLGRAILARAPCKIPGGTGSGGASDLIGIDISQIIGDNVFALKASGGIVTAAVTLTGALCLRISGQGSVIAVGGPKGGFFRMPFAGVFTGWTILADQLGSIELDVWKADLALYPPTIADTIVAANPPQIVGDDTAVGTVATWDDTFTADDVFAFRVASIDTIQAMTLEIKTERT